MTEQNTEIAPPSGHRYHVVDGLGGPWLCETTDTYPEPTPIGRVDDLLKRLAAVETLAHSWAQDETKDPAYALWLLAALDGQVSDQ